MYPSVLGTPLYCHSLWSISWGSRPTWCVSYTLLVRERSLPALVGPRLSTLAVPSPGLNLKQKATGDYVQLSLKTHKFAG